MPSGIKDSEHMRKLGEATQWKPGERPVGAGKPKGSKHINTWIQELLEDEEFETQIQEGYRIVEYKGAPIKAIIKAQMIKAVNGDTKAFDSLAKYGWSQKTETDLNIKQMPQSLLGGQSVSSNDSDRKTVDSEEAE